jgi:hypothetical protein
MQKRLRLVALLAFSPNFAYGPDGTFRGQNRQAARTAQVSLQFEF